jgi:hypothetical protein
VASPGKILPVTALLIAGQVLPFLLLPFAGVASLPTVLAAWLPRWIAVRRFRQPFDGALLHPLGILVFLAVQWYALGRQLLGRPAGWKERAYSPSAS